MRRDEYVEQVMQLTRSLYYVSSSILPVMQDREDAIQNSIVKGLQKCETLRDRDKFRGWITRILINECYTILRQKKRVVLAEEVPQPPPGEVDLALHDAVMSLPDRIRVPFTLQLEGYTAREIAQSVGIPEGTAKTLIREAKLALRAALADGEEVLA